MTLNLPWDFSASAPAGDQLEDRLQENFDRIKLQFPVAIQNVVQVPQARVYNSTAFTVANNTLTAVTFDSERWDTNSIHDTSSNTSRLTCVTPGLYSISGHVSWVAAAGGVRRYVGIRLNGSTLIAEQEKTNSATLGMASSVSTDYRLVAGDYVELVVKQDSGGNLNVQAAGNSTPEFSMHWVSP